MTGRLDLDLAGLKGRLVARQDELTRMVANSLAASDPVELDQARVGRLSRMDAMQNQAMAVATEERRKAELRRIESALLRIGEEEYGYCASCGEEIPPKRLELDPTTPLCVDCAGAVKR